MIFASDLDKTLIHFQRKSIPMDDLVVTERADTGYSVMSKQAYADLIELRKSMLFVPTTTRSIKQYSRIPMFMDTPPQYAILSNGGRIMVDGVFSEEWDDYIASLSGKNNAKHEDIEELLSQTLESDIFPSFKFTDELFWYAKLKNSESVERFKQDFVPTLNGSGWISYVHGSKVFALPLHVDKAVAVKYIMEKENLNYLIAAGDSTMDDTMLRMADLSLVPKHGDIHSLSHAAQYTCTESEGIYATDEILRHVKERAPSIR